jgi:hypothetical protein
MGLFRDKFSGLSKQEQLTLGPAESFAAITLSAIAADGYFSDEEIRLLTTTLSSMKLFRSYSSDVMRRMLDRLLSILLKSGSDVLLKAAVANLPHDLYETAFAITTDLILADGEVTAEEEEILNILYRVLEIPEETALKIIDVMMIKNRG